MRILYIITQADGGGAQKYTLALAKHFNGEIAAGNEAEKLFDDALKSGLMVHRLKYLKRSIHPFYDLLALFELVALIRKTKPGIVHLNSSKAGFLGSLAGAFTNAKIVFTAHGFIFNEPFSPFIKWCYLMLEKFASLFRDYIITVSDADKKSALDNHLISPNKISTIHNGSPSINFLSREEACGKLRLPPDKIILGSVANFYKTKGLDVLIDAISQLNTDLLTKIHLAIIGEGKERILLEKKILEYELGPKVTLIGNLPDAAAYLKAFDVFILPSRKEGFPFVLLEAMQAGLPIIASKVGGIPEGLEDGGLQVPPEDAKALADGITALFSDANLKQQFALRAKQRSQLFSQEKMLEETKKVYEKIILI